MAGQPWTDTETQQLRDLTERGVGYVEIAGRLGRSSQSVAKRLQRMKEDAAAAAASVCTAPSVPQTEFEAMAKSAGAVRQPQAPLVQSAWIDEEPMQEIWARHEQTNARKIEKAKDAKQFTVDLPADEPIALAFVSDQHISPGTPVDMARMRADAEYIRDTPNLYALLGGDGIDNHIKHRGAMLAMRSTASDQYRLFEYYLSIFAPKILALCSGNHDAWTKNMAGVDVLDYIAERQRLCYSPHGFTIRVTVCGQEYVVCLRHRYKMNSTLNQTHSPKQLWRFGEIDFDAGVVCHHHEPAMEMCVFRGLDRFVARPGSYQITSSYSEQFGYNSTYPTCPTVVLYPRRRRLTGFHDMRDAGEFLRGKLR